MKKKKIILLVITITFLTGIYFFRNHIRLFLLKKKPLNHSEIKHLKTSEEIYFKIDIYLCKRNFTNHLINFCNNLFTDELMVVRIPIENFEFKNLILQPIGNNVHSGDATIYFNTLFFDNNYIATTGIIDDKININDKTPRKKRFGIDEYGSLNSFSSGKNAEYNDVLQAPFIFKLNSKTKINFRTLNYRQFVTIKNNELYYFSGYGNSLISWLDIKEVMKVMKIESVIALDGGASLDYCFKGEKNKYCFSSLPLRNFISKFNSPYYLEATIKP